MRIDEIDISLEEVTGLDGKMEYFEDRVLLNFETKNYFIDLIIFDFRTLIVTFEPGGEPFYRPNPHRSGWRVHRFIRERVSTLAIKPKSVDWYIEHDIHDALLYLNKILMRFSVRVAYGASMGAYGALLHSQVLDAHRIVAISPQTTLNQRLLPEENRYPYALKLDWDGPFGDALSRLNRASEVYAIYDPMNILDKLHVARIRSGRVTEIRVRFFGHKIPIALKQSGGFTVVDKLCLDGRLDIQTLVSSMRKLRISPERLTRLRSEASKRPGREIRLSEAVNVLRGTEDGVGVPSLVGPV